MRRWVIFWVCAVLGLVLLMGGLLVPAHLRAVDAGVLERVGKRTPTLVERGLSLIKGKQLGAAQLLFEAAQQERVSGWQEIGLALNDAGRQHPGWLIWGGAEPRLEALFETDPSLPKAGSEPFTDFVIRLENRQRVLELLAASARPAVQELLRVRALTNTVIFPPSPSASGQALDAALSECGLLLEVGRLTDGLSNVVQRLATRANRGDPQGLEQVLMDLMSLGQRFDWGQLVTFVGRIRDAETLRSQTELVRRAGAQLPVLFSAVELSSNPSGVARYVMSFSQTGLTDLGQSLRFGAGGINELVSSQRRLYRPSLFQKLAALAPFRGVMGLVADACWRTPGVGLALKWLFYLASGFFIAAALHFARPAVSALEQPLQVRGFHVAREILFALGFLLVVLLLSEPFLAQESQKVEFPFRLRLPTVGHALPAGTTSVRTFHMNPTNLMALLLFFVLQGLLYTACLVKLAEIRRQRVQPRIKLRLLENEEHLFDAGLYLGFLGTIISFILYSVGMVKEFSLMVAYSSTSFGIIFVSLFKIVNLRPAKRKLVLESEAGVPEPVRSTAAPALATSS